MKTDTGGKKKSEYVNSISLMVFLKTPVASALHYVHCNNLAINSSFASFSSGGLSESENAYLNALTKYVSVAFA